MLWAACKNLYCPRGSRQVLFAFCWQSHNFRELLSGWIHFHLRNYMPRNYILHTSEVRKAMGNNKYSSPLQHITLLNGDVPFISGVLLHTLGHWILVLYLNCRQWVYYFWKTRGKYGIMEVTPYQRIKRLQYCNLLIRHCQVEFTFHLYNYISLTSTDIIVNRC